MQKNTEHHLISVFEARAWTRKRPKHHLRIIKEWITFLELREVSLDEVTVKTAEQYKAWSARQVGLPGNVSNSKKRANASIANYIGILRALYSYAVRIGETDFNPFSTVESPKPDRNRKRYLPSLSPEQVRAICDAPDTSTVAGLKEAAVYRLLFYCAFRVSEVLSLRLSHVSVRSGVVQVYLGGTKAGADRVVPVPKAASALLVKYLKVRRVEYDLQEEHLRSNALFPGSRGAEFLSPATVRRWLKARAVSIGIPESEVSTHTGRITAITTMLRQGKSHEQVRLLTGHASTNMIAQVYDRRLEAQKVGHILDFDY